MLIAVDYATFVSLVSTFGHPVFYTASPFKAVTQVDAFAVQHTALTKPGSFDEDFPSAYEVSAMTY